MKLPRPAVTPRVRLDAKPGFAQLLLWKIVYEYEGQFFVDGVRTGIQTKVYPGTHISKLDSQWAAENLPPNSQTLQDFERFRWFSNDYLALSETNLTPSSMSVTQ